MSDVDRVAIHEASHALAAVALGLPLRLVQLRDYPACYRFLHDPRPDQRNAEVMTLMAGAAGEVLYFGAAIGDSGDREQIERLLQGDAKTEAALRRQVRLLIAGNYPAVCRIADALLRDGMLTGDEVERLVRGKTFRRGHP